MKVNIEVTAGPAKGRTFSIDQADLFIVGRAKDSKVSLPNDPYLSRQHFVLEIAPPNCKITDLGSKNGTFVNGVRYGGRKPDPKIKQAPEGALSVTIQSGEIVVGDTRMKVSLDEANGATRSSNRLPALNGNETVVRQTPSKTKKSEAQPDDDPLNLEAPPKDDAVDSSLGFLVPRTSVKSLDAKQVPAPASNPSSLHINAPRRSTPKHANLKSFESPTVG